MSTKEKILMAAAEEFAEKGYYGATIRDICDHAGVNIAAVNYHFSSKAFLYEKVFEYLFEKTEKRNPKSVNLNISTESEWQRELKGYISRMMKSCTSNDKYERYLYALFAREMLNPSELFPAIYDRLLAPRLDNIKSLFRLGDIKNEDELNICVISLISNALTFAEKQVFIGQLTGNVNFGADHLDSIVDNIFATTIARIRYKG